MGFEIPGADWCPISMDEAAQRFDIDEDDVEAILATWRAGFDEDVQVHRGDLVVSGPVEISCCVEPRTLYIIDGSLTVHNTFSFTNTDVYTTLWVAGDVAGDNVRCGGSVQFVVGGSLHVNNLLLTDLGDVGSLLVKDVLSAAVWFEADSRGEIRAGRPQARRLLTADGSVKDGWGFDRYFVREFGEDVAVESARRALLPEFVEDGGQIYTGGAIHDAMLAGRPVLRQ
jgi:hypothetical protein